jgi:L-2,4-diaminobutyric acid acetyltransferase
MEKMKISKFNNHYSEKVRLLLANNAPYVVPHHEYVYWIMEEYFPSLNFIVHECDTVVGFICAIHSIEKNCVFIWQLAIDHKYKRQGVATILCEKIFHYCRDNNVNSIQLTINDKNVASIQFFTSFSQKMGMVFEKLFLDGIEDFKDESAYKIFIQDKKHGHETSII